MADLALVRRPSGKYDFLLKGGDLALTTDASLAQNPGVFLEPYPAVFRLLLQGTWIGDDGERAGESLGDVKLSTARTRDQVQRIVETRLGAMLRSGQLTSVSVLDVVTKDARLFASISVTVAGQEPRTVQVPLTA